MNEYVYVQFDDDYGDDDDVFLIDEKEMKMIFHDQVIVIQIDGENVAEYHNQLLLEHRLQL
jgi:hypothetical protein